MPQKTLSQDQLGSVEGHGFGKIGAVVFDKGLQRASYICV